MSASFSVLFSANISNMDFLGFYATEKTKNVAESIKIGPISARKWLKPIPIKYLHGSEPKWVGYKKVLHGEKKWNMANHNTKFSSFDLFRELNPG